MKKIFLPTIAIFLSLLYCFIPNSAFAQSSSAEFILYPKSGWIKPNTEFTVDVLINTNGEEVTLARSVVTFDPQLIKVTKAERNDSLFCTWPADEQTIDNTEGVVMATGFCQSGSGTLYKTTGDSDVFVRLTFEALKEGNLVLDWEYSGQDQPFKSVIMKNGSPTTNILNSAPSKGTYILSIKDPNAKPPVPETGIFSSDKVIIVSILGLGILSFAFGFNLILDPKRKYFNDAQTIVVYDRKK